MLEESQRRASRISGGAAAEPRRNDEFLSKGIPSSVGAPHGSFRSVLDMACLTSSPSHYLTPAHRHSAGGLVALRWIPHYHKTVIPSGERRRRTQSRDLVFRDTRCAMDPATRCRAWCGPLESHAHCRASVILVVTSMATRNPKTSSISTSLMEAPSSDRERVFDLFRHWGYLEADLDPLGLFRPQLQPELQIESEYAREARRAYCGTIGVEFVHITDGDRRRWIQEHMEAEPGLVDQARVLDLLVRADIFEQVLQQRYLGTKRFSLEGNSALLPLVDEILDGAGQRGAINLVMGMSHRGRLNVLLHVARRTPEEVFAAFEDVDPRSVLGSGDVKYHLGATGEYITRSGAKVNIHLVSNPSHLEAVDPVTIGRTRAKQDRAGEGGREKYLPLLVHGDAAFAGQGIFAETMNFADLPGYTVGGTIHIIVNNLVGFTTNHH